MLIAAGWRVLRFWEHEPAEAVVEAICAALSRPAGRARQVTSRPVESQDAGSSMSAVCGVVHAEVLPGVHLLGHPSAVVGEASLTDVRSARG